MNKKQENKQNDDTMSAPKSSRLWGLFWLLVLIFVDQLTKLVADVYFIDIAGEGNAYKGLGERIVLIPDMLVLCISYNRGIAFSSFATAGAPAKIGIIVGTAVVMLFLAIWYCKIDNRRSWVRCALILVIAGGLGNLIDRAYYQVWDPATDAIIRDGVRDMVYLNVIFDFGVCNFADFFVCIGAVVLVLALVFFDQDAMFPLGKYKQLAKEAEARDEAKKAAKQAAKKEKAPTENEENNG